MVSHAGPTVRFLGSGIRRQSGRGGAGFEIHANQRDGIGEMVRGQITMDWTLVSLSDV